MDIDLKKFELEQSIKTIESRIADKEKARNMKMQSNFRLILADFEKERNFLIDQQKAVKLQIEAISNEKNNEKAIQSIKNQVRKYFQLDRLSTRNF